MDFRFKPRVFVHPDRYGVRKTMGANRLLVLHTSEGGESPSAAESLCSFMGMPGDRVDPSDGSRYGASYQYVTDTDGGVWPAVPDDIVSYSAAGANHDGVHICFPGKAGQTRTQWMDADSTAHMEAAANLLRVKSIGLQIPLKRLMDVEIAAGGRGYCDHGAISRVYGRSTHTDVGTGFPWDVLADMLIELPPTPGGSEMVALKEAVRIYDSRGAQNGGKKVAGGTTVRVGVLSPPAGFQAAIVDIGVTEPEGHGFLSLTNATTSVQDFAPGETKSNTWLAPLTQQGGGWGFDLLVSAAAHIIVELQGWAPVI